MTFVIPEERVAERIRKVWALAQSGISGEKENASRILEKMLSDNGISLEDVLREEVEKGFKVVLKNDFDLRLLLQTYSQVASANSMRYYKKGKSIYFFATTAHGIETLSLFSLYKNALQGNFDLLFKAFIYKNDIYNRHEKEDNTATLQHEPTSEEITELHKLRNMMDSVDRVKINKMIDGEKHEY